MSNLFHALAQASLAVSGFFDTLASAFAYVTPTVVFAVAVLAVCGGFCGFYWYAVRPRPNSLEWIAMAESRPRRLLFPRCRPMERRDALPLLFITAAYAATAFFRLGDTAAVQSYARFEADTRAAFSFDRPRDVSAVYFFTGICTGSYTLEYSADGRNWTALELDQSYSRLLKWQVAERTVEDGEGGERTETAAFRAAYFRLSASPRADDAHPERNYLDLGELAFWDGEGELIPVLWEEGDARALFDEQELVPRHSFWTNSAYFDEIYHPRTAQEHRLNIAPYEISHPPLGKLIIALGIQLFGLTPFGWRFMGTLFGVLMLPVLYVLLKNMFGRTAVAACGTTLFAVDFMHLVQTRIATIDTYAVFFILGMYLFMYRWLTLPPEAGLRRSAPSLFLCGLMWGIGVACKWTVIYGGVGLAILWVIGMALKYRAWTPGRRPGYAAFFWGTAALSAVCFAAIPLAIYIAAYIPYARADGDLSLGHLLRVTWENQVYMLTYHSGVDSPHPYASRWYQWIVDGRPILYFREQDLYPGRKALFASFNSPLVSWCGLLCVMTTAVEAFRRKSARALFITLGYLSQLVPWIFIARITFAYHYFPSVLFLVLAIAYAMDAMLERGRGRPRLAVYGVTGLAVGLYAAFYPVLIGLYVPSWYSWNLLRWLPSWPL